jgi:hypothetical protein
LLRWIYGVARTTSDVDFLGVVPSLWSELVNLAGRGSGLHQTHKVYLHPVTVVTPPVDYEERMVELYPGEWTHLKLFALEAHDLALTKLERNIDRDREDVQTLASGGYLRPEILKDRYHSEMRPYLKSHEARHDLTLQLWLESYF